MNLKALLCRIRGHEWRTDTGVLIRCTRCGTPFVPDPATS